MVQRCVNGTAVLTGLNCSHPLPSPPVSANRTTSTTTTTTSTTTTLTPECTGAVLKYCINYTVIVEYDCVNGKLVKTGQKCVAATPTPSPKPPPLPNIPFDDLKFFNFSGTIQLDKNTSIQLNATRVSSASANAFFIGGAASYAVLNFSDTKQTVFMRINDSYTTSFQAKIFLKNILPPNNTRDFPAVMVSGKDYRENEANCSANCSNCAVNCSTCSRVCLIQLNKTQLLVFPNNWNVSVKVEKIIGGAAQVQEFFFAYNSSAVLFNKTRVTGDLSKALLFYKVKDAKYYAFTSWEGYGSTEDKVRYAFTKPLYGSVPELFFKRYANDTALVMIPEVYSAALSKTVFTINSSRQFSELAYDYLPVEQGFYTVYGVVYYEISPYNLWFKYPK